MFGGVKVKCCIVGDFNVGKTSILHSYLDKSAKDVATTVGIDFFSKTVSVGERSVYMTLWDTAGAERFHSLIHSYLRDMDLAILVYDTSKRHSNIVFWMRCIEQYHPKVIGVIGNKSDLTHVNVDNMDDLLFPWKRQSKVILHETLSARNPEKVKSFFKRCLQVIVADKPANSDMRYVQLEPRMPESRKCCT